MIGSSVISVRVLHLMRRVAFDWVFPELCAPYWRFYWNLDGSGFVTIGPAKRELCPHTAYLIPPDTQFSAHGKRLDHFYIHFVLPDDAVFTRTGLYEVTRSDELRPAVQSLADRVLDGSSPLIEDRCTIAAAGLVLSSLSRLPADVTVANVRDPILRDAIRFIADRLDTRLTSEEIAIACRCDERTLRRRFRAELNVTPVQFATRRRLERSCMLLHFTTLAIEEIARQTGFCDRHHFTRAFQRARGTSPAAFRRISDQLIARPGVL